MADLPSSVSKLHVLAVPLPAQGHVNPMIRFCRKLASLGVIVTFVNVDAISDRITQVQNTSGKTNDKEGRRLDIRMVSIPVPGISLAKDFRFSFKDFFTATETIGNALEELVKNISERGPPVTCLISDVALSITTQEVADKFGIPRVALTSASQSSYLYWIYASEGRICLEDVQLAAYKGFVKDRKDLLGDLPGLPALHYEDLQTLKHTVDDTEFLYQFVPRQMRNLKEKCKNMLANTFYELEGHAINETAKQISVYPVGPLLEELEEECRLSLWQEGEGCLEWLEKQPPSSVLYISFGSITTLSTLQLRNILLALEACQQRFLGSFRPDLVEGDSCKLLDDLVSRTKDLAHVVPWAPQTRILSHSSVGGFLTHCGWNSTIESIGRGVPMLCWPYFADQFLNRRFIVEEWKVGLDFEADDDGVVRKEEVERVVRALMREEVGREMRRKARELSESVRLGDLPDLHIKRFIQDMKKW